MMGHAFRVRNYRLQNGQERNSYNLTPAQRRRARKKLGHALGKKRVTNIQTVKG